MGDASLKFVYVSEIRVEELSKGIKSICCEIIYGNNVLQYKESFSGYFATSGYFVWQTLNSLKKVT